MSERDIDAEFDAIIAHWGDDAPQPPKPRTVQDITTAYAALSPPETTSPEPVVESPETEAGEDESLENQASENETREPVAERDADSMTRTDPFVDDATTEEPEAWRQGPSIDDEDDHFEPGPVQLPPSEDIGYWGAIVGLVGGPLLMVWIALTGPFYRGWWILGSIVLFLGGFAVLVMRQPRQRDPHDDDGARV